MSGLASDANDGQTITTPISTTSENNRRMRLGSDASRLISATTTILYMSEDLQALGPNPVGVELSPLRLRAPLIIQMTPVVVRAAGGATLDAGTVAINPLAAGGGQKQTAHVTDIADWGPFVFNGHGLGGAATIPTRIFDVVTGDAGWIVSGTGIATASISRPVDPAVTVPGALTIGNAYRVQRPGVLHLSTTPSPIADSPQQYIFNDCAFTLGSTGAVGNTAFTQQPRVFNHCAFLDILFIGGSVNDCYLCDGTQGVGVVTMTAGVLLTNPSAGQNTGLLGLSADTYVTGDTALTVGGAFYATIFIFASALGLADSGAQVQDMSGGQNGFALFAGGTVLMSGLLWGKGNTGNGIAISPGSTLDCFNTVPSLTGALSDFALNNTVHVARAWDDAVGAYTEAGGPATRATTWANLVTAIGGGGFGAGLTGAAHDLLSNSHIVAG